MLEKISSIIVTAEKIAIDLKTLPKDTTVSHILNTIFEAVDGLKSRISAIENQKIQK